MSHRALGSQFTGYHTSPAINRESIEEHGLDPAKGESGYSIDYPSGVYLFGSRDHAEQYRGIREQEDSDLYGAAEDTSYDMYEVTVPKKSVRQDPFHDDESGLGKTSVYVPGPVPRSSLRRLT